MRYLTMVALTVFFIGWMNDVKAGTEWAKGTIVSPGVVCHSVDPLVKYGKARSETVVDLLRGFFATNECYTIPPILRVTLQEYMMTFDALGSDDRPIKFEVWKVEGKKENYIMIMERSEAVRRGLVKRKVGATL